MINDALAGKIDIIFCKSVSRWARNTLDGLRAIKRLTGNHVHIVFEQEGIDTRQPGVIFNLNVAAAIAQAESESISENLKWIYRRRAEQGIFMAQRGKYFGYNTDDGSFHLDENADHVRDIFN